MDNPDSPQKLFRIAVKDMIQMPKYKNDDSLDRLSNLNKKVREKLSVGPATFTVVCGSSTPRDAFETLDAHLREKSASKGLNVIHNSGGMRHARTYICAHSHRRQGTKMTKM